MFLSLVLCANDTSCARAVRCVCVFNAGKQRTRYKRREHTHKLLQRTLITLLQRRRHLQPVVVERTFEKFVELNCTMRELR